MTTEPRTDDVPTTMPRLHGPLFADLSDAAVNRLLEMFDLLHDEPDLPVAAFGNYVTGAS
jgi:hypothetical protein